MPSFNPEVAASELSALIAEKHARFQKQLDQIQAQINRPDPGYSFSGNGADGTLLAISKKVWEHAIPSFRLSKRGVVEVGAFPLITKAITSASLGLAPYQVPAIAAPGVPKIRVRQLIPIEPTNNNAITFVRETAFSNAASPVAETVSKPQSELTFTAVVQAVQTIAHFVPCPKQAADDFQSLRAYIEGRLIDGLFDVEDWELLFGDGTGIHQYGIYTQATAYAGTYSAEGDTRIDVLGHAIRELADTNTEVDGFVLNPSDWLGLCLVKTEEGGANKGAYILGHPAALTTPQLFGRPVATTTAMRSGEFLVGNFRSGAALYDRQNATVDVSESHHDWFTRNLLCLRAEERVALCVYSPAKFVRGLY